MPPPSANRMRAAASDCLPDGASLRDGRARRGEGSRVFGGCALLMEPAAPVPSKPRRRPCGRHPSHAAVHRKSGAHPDLRRSAFPVLPFLRGSSRHPERRTNELRAVFSSCPAMLKTFEASGYDLEWRGGAGRWRAATSLPTRECRECRPPACNYALRHRPAGRHWQILRAKM